MPVINCPYPSCTYATGDVTDELALTLLQIHNAGSHAPAAAAAAPVLAPTAGIRVQKVNRPTVCLAGTSEEWNYFLTRWDDYVEATQVRGKERIIQLLECCEEDLRKDLTRSAGGSLSNKTEAEVKAAIKLLAVREENTMVARVALYEMRQDDEEPIRSYGARIRGQANVCKYTIDCPTCEVPVSYTDAMLRDVLTRGIADSEIQLDLLGASNQDMSLEETLRFIEAKESGKRSANRLLQIQAVNSARASQYQQKKRAELTNRHTSKMETCDYCGKQGHGKNGPPQTRKKDCPAYGKTCSACKRLNHFATVCRSKDKIVSADGGAGAVFHDMAQESPYEHLCAISNTHVRSIVLDHHLYNHLEERWTRKPSKPQPFITLTASICRDDYRCFGLEPLTGTKSIKVSAMADTGCQSSLTGMKLVRRLGLSETDLIPVNMQMHAANNNKIAILGAVLIQFSGTTAEGDILSTRQLTYVTDQSDKLFLSREGCIKLGMISETFPTVGDISRKLCSSQSEEVHTDASYCGTTTILAENVALTNHVTDTDTTPNDLCGCPRRELPPPKPLKLPVPATGDNVRSLEEYLLNYYKSSTFNTCPHQLLPLMNAPQLRLYIDDHASPVAHNKPIPVPIHWQDEVKSGLDQDVRLGVLEPVPIGTTVTWCHQMVICAKKDGKPRRTIDFQALNKYAKRETHHTPSPFHQARSIPANKLKSVFDCWNGYHSIPLHPDDRHYTTFITPWGRYRYKTAPQGYTATGDGYTRRFDEIVADVPNKTKIIDDSCHWANTIEKSFFQAVDWLDLCGHHGIILNPEKFVFAREIVTFAGFEITMDSVRPTTAFLASIQDFPSPKQLTDLRSWFGLLNQAAYSFASSTQLLPFRELLKPGVPFIWTDELNKLFERSKSVIITEIEDGVRIFEKSRPTCLATDWSKSGIGHWLSQKHCKCPSNVPFCCKSGWKITLVGSRFTRGAESRYAPIEGEALAVVAGLDKTRYYVLGCTDLTVAVDHKPLLQIFNDRSLNDIPNTRLRNLKEKTLRYKFRMVHIPGPKQKVADTVSRYPSTNNDPMLYLEDDIAAIHLNDQDQDLPLSSIQEFLDVIRCDETTDTSIDDEVLSTAVAALNSVEVTTWEKVKLATTSNDTMIKLLSTIENGFPAHRDDLPMELQEYHQFRADLSGIDGVILYKDRVVIPPCLRRSVLDALHSAHHGISTMAARIEASVFWPGITGAIQQLRSTCQDCDRNAPSQPNPPPTPPIIPRYPFQCICADYFHHKGSYYLIIVDRYSNWLIVERGQGGSKGLLTCLRRTFATYGIADECASDGGPEFIAAATQNFLISWGVHHRKSSVAFPHSNCRAEIGVKSAKRLIMSNTGPNGNLDADTFQRAILQHRNMPDPITKVSPAMCVFGRPIKDFIPILPGKYEPHPTWQDMLSAREEALRNRHLKAAEKWNEHTKRLAPLAVGDHVRIQNQTGSRPTKWDRTGRITEVRQFDQYNVRVDGSGRSTLRNRKFLRKFEPLHRDPPPLAITRDIELLGTMPKSQSEVRRASSGGNVPETIPPATPIPSSPPPLANLQYDGTPAVQPLPNVDAPPPVSPSQQSDIDRPAVQVTPASSPPAPPISPIATRKPPLALRRLLSYNHKGLTE